MINELTPTQPKIYEVETLEERRKRIKPEERVRQMRPLNDADRAYMRRLANRGVTGVSILRRMRRLNIDAKPYDVAHLGSMFLGNGRVVSVSIRMREDTYNHLRNMARSLGYEWNSHKKEERGTVGALPAFLTAIVNGKIKIEIDDGEEPEKYYGPEDWGAAVPNSRTDRSNPEYARFHEPRVNWYPSKAEQLADAGEDDED